MTQNELDDPDRGIAIKSLESPQIFENFWKFKVFLLNCYTEDQIIPKEARSSEENSICTLQPSVIHFPSLWDQNRQLSSSVSIV